jgi:molybdate transport system regulatory protein
LKEFEHVVLVCFYEVDNAMTVVSWVGQGASTSFCDALGHSASDKRLEVLRRVAESGSISQAARDAGISYKAAWQAVDTLTSLSGAVLVERTVGGSGGGGARITPQGRALLDLAQQLSLARQRVLDDFAGGAQLASGLGLRTSMRNQLPCRVLDVQPASPDDPAVWVDLQTPGSERLTASITRESVDLLGLQPGLEVLVLCKATAVVVAAAGGPQADANAGVPACALSGTVARVSAGAQHDEVVLALTGGGHWVGFAPHGLALGLGEAVIARTPAAALVVGLPS